MWQHAFMKYFNSLLCKRVQIWIRLAREVSAVEMSSAWQGKALSAHGFEQELDQVSSQDPVQLHLYSALS